MSIVLGTILLFLLFLTGGVVSSFAVGTGNDFPVGTQTHPNTSYFLSSVKLLMSNLIR